MSSLTFPHFSAIILILKITKSDLAISDVKWCVCSLSHFSKLHPLFCDFFKTACGSNFRYYEL
jgi:hypothetical protein